MDLSAALSLRYTARVPREELPKQMSASPDDSISSVRAPRQRSESPEANPQHGDESFVNSDSPVHSFRMSQLGIWKSASLGHPFWIESVYEYLSGQITSDVMKME
ncbi:hypothetical protein CDAR_202241 [Caerostris darwini]|uniref:Uncharacterized protein n=1 Tax=Caerostris darwini TaxID=1538125 RepID=A0AAV4SUV0_9ARAC|nr:hypothetical protein CDAR_202241 [Caerostris darwini]